MSRARVNPALLAAVAAANMPKNSTIAIDRGTVTQEIKDGPPVDSLRGVSTGKYMGPGELAEYSRRRRRARNTHPRKRRGRAA